MAASFVAAIRTLITNVNKYNNNNNNNNNNADDNTNNNNNATKRKQLINAIVLAMTPTTYSRAPRPCPAPFPRVAPMALRQRQTVFPPSGSGMDAIEVVCHCKDL